MAYLGKNLWRRSRRSTSLRLAREMDMTILLPALILALIGVAMVYSATFSKPEISQLYLKQILWISAGSLGLVFFASFNYHALLQRYAYPVYWMILVLLAVLLALGEQISGSQRWIQLGPIGFQPSEFAKVATTLVLAKYLAGREEQIKRWKVILGAFLLAGLPMGLILRQPDLGTALVFIPLTFAMLFIVGVSWQRLLGIAMTGILASPLIWLLLKEYQRQRLRVFLTPSMDSLGAGYNVIQSKIAIGSGAAWGKGWLAGTQGQLRFLPEHHTDFIFSVMAEEWGFLGSLILVMLFSILLLQSLRVARSARDMSGSLTAVGLTTIIFTQVGVNLGVATGIVPVTGMTLPFISYGGSSIIASMCMLGILMSIWSGRKVK